MSTILSIDLVTEDGNRLLARIDEADVLIGRAPAPKGVAIQSMAISATHGKFVRFHEHWFYRDLQSTNGSWFSSRIISPNSFHLIKDGDHLILGNTQLQLRTNYSMSDDQYAALQEPTIFIFWQDRLKVVLPLPRHNQFYAIGGSESVVELPANFVNTHKLILKADGRRCIFESHQVGGGLYHNTTQISPSAQVLMSDRDSIITGQLVIIYSSGYAKIDGEAIKEEVGTFIDPSARYSKKLITNSGFGKLLEEPDENRVVIRTEGIVRPVVSYSPEEDNLVGDKIIYLIGFIALIATIGLLFWYLIS